MDLNKRNLMLSLMLIFTPLSVYSADLNIATIDPQTALLSTEVAIQVYSRTIPDVTEGALWYHATYIRKPFWAYSFREKVKINEHIFYTGK